MPNNQKNTVTPKMTVEPRRQCVAMPIEPPPPPGTYPLSGTWHDDQYLMNLLGIGKRAFRYWLKMNLIYYVQVSGRRRRFNEADILDFLRRSRRCGAEK